MIAYVFMGQYDQALKFSAEAYQISLDINNIWGQWQSRSKIGCVHWERGRPDLAIEVLEDVVRLGELGGYPLPLTHTRADLALVYGELGLFERGLETARLALEADAQFPQFLVHILAVLAHLHLKQGDLARAQALIDQARTEGYPFLALYFLPVVEAELALQQQDFKQALQVTESFLKILHQFEIRTYLPATLYFRGQAHLALNQPEAARNCWQEARAIAEEIGSRCWLWQILFALSQLEPDPVQAKQLRQQAHEIIDYFTEHTPSDFRDSFLGLPEVRAVLAE